VAIPLQVRGAPPPLPHVLSYSYKAEGSEGACVCGLGTWWIK